MVCSSNSDKLRWCIKHKRTTTFMSTMIALNSNIAASVNLSSNWFKRVNQFKSFGCESHRSILKLNMIYI